MIVTEGKVHVGGGNHRCAGGDVGIEIITSETPRTDSHLLKIDTETFQVFKDVLGQIAVSAERNAELEHMCVPLALDPIDVNALLLELFQHLVRQITAIAERQSEVE